MSQIWLAVFWLSMRPLSGQGAREIPKQWRKVLRKKALDQNLDEASVPLTSLRGTHLPNSPWHLVDLLAWKETAVFFVAQQGDRLRQLF
jgi:hypothetical protein